MYVGRPSVTPPKAAPKPAPPPRTLTTGANPRGVAITPEFKQAVKQVYHAQPPAAKQAIVRAAAQNPSHPISVALGISKAYGHEPGGAMALEPHGLGAIQRSVAPLTAAQVKQDENSGNIDFGAVPRGIVGGLAALRNATQIGSSGPGNTATFGSMGPKVATNAAKDLINLPGETVSTIGTIGKDVVTGKPGKALSDIVSPYEQMIRHPAQAFLEHPLLTTLMATGALHGASRLAAAPIRALKPDALSTTREGVALTGNLTHERPPFSKSPTIAMQQKAIERQIYTRAPTGELVPKAEWLRKHQLNQEIGGLVGVRERIRAANREAVHVQREAAVRPKLPARVAHSVKTALAYSPKQAVIPGASVLARIADGTIRRPDTVVADLQKHLEQVSANRPNLLDEPQALKAHDQYVKQLQGALKDKAFLKNPAPAFKAAVSYAKDYRPLEAQAAKLGHFGDMPAEALQRRELMHYAVTHMGAKMDPELGLLASNGARLSNEAILNHLRGPEGTGGRIPAFTSDRVRFDREKAARQANYVSSERRPTPVTKKNQLYAYTHGLTNPGHDALTGQHVLMRGVVDAHHAQNAYLEALATQKPGGGYWSTYEAANREKPKGYAPINIAQMFHPQASLDKATADMAPASIEEEAVRRSLDLNARLQPGTTGRWAVIDQHALKVLSDHQNQISPNPLLRTIRGLNNQFRTVALSTSAKHIPGVTQENLIRAAAQGIGFRSWVTGRRMLQGAEKLSPERGRELSTALRGGQVAGMTEAGKTYMVSDHWAGTTVYPVLKAMEASFRTPGLRQIRTAWRTWTHFAIRGTKRALEQQMQTAALGKAALREHGYAEAARVDGFVGLAHRAFGLHGRMLEDATKGLFDPAKARQMRAVINQIAGKWTDLSPSAQTALMFSPFGLWWANSVRFLARMPVDQPVKTSLLASATAGTEQERRAQGLEIQNLTQLLGGNPPAGMLPSYEQGGIPVGGKIVAQNYYSPFGVANDPIATGSSLIQPWATGPLVLGPLGLNWLGRQLASPGNPHGRTPATGDQRIQSILDSVLASFVPLYTKAEQIAQGGASAYDVTDHGALPPLLQGKAPPTKTPGKGFAAGLKKATLPVREYKMAPAKGAKASNWWTTGHSASGSKWWSAPPASSSGAWWK